MNNQNPPPNVYMGGNPQYVNPQMPQQPILQQGMQQGMGSQPPMYNQGMSYQQQRMMQQQHLMMGEQQQANLIHQQQHQQYLLHQQQQQIAQASYQRPQMVPANFPTSFDPPQPKKPMFERVKNLLPAPLSFELLDKTDEMSIIQLCMQGRDIVTELSIRFMNVLTTLRTGMDRRNHCTDIEAMLVYIRFLFKKLIEIRIRIDRARADQPEISTSNFFDYITDGPSTEEGTEEKQRAQKTFETNRIAIVNKGNAIKKLEWVFSVADPQFQDM